MMQGKIPPQVMLCFAARGDVLSRTPALLLQSRPQLLLKDHSLSSPPALSAIAACALASYVYICDEAGLLVVLPVV